MASKAEVMPVYEVSRKPTMAPKRRSWGKTIVLACLYATVALIMILFLAQMVWRFSGSNQWEKVLDEKGIVVYTLKAPGADLLQLRASVQIHSTLSGIVAWMQDPDACKDSGCTDSYTVEKVSEQLEYNYFQFPYPAPFKKRDFVIRSVFYQNSQSKEVLLLVGAVADRIPKNDCCFRVNNMNNRWRFTPLGNGDIRVEMENNLDPGGYIPNYLFNSKRPRGMHTLLSKLQGWVGQDKYQRAKYSFIQEIPEANPLDANQTHTH